MKKIVQLLRVIALMSIIGICAIGCATQVDPVLAVCKIQEDESSCLTMGNDILMLSEEYSQYECVWNGQTCISKLI